MREKKMTRQQIRFEEEKSWKKGGGCTKLYKISCTNHNSDLVPTIYTYLYTDQFIRNYASIVTPLKSHNANV